MSILKNAIDSIALGLEDYEYSASDKRRILSCTRNIYAGILLLFKYKLSSLSEPNTDEALIKERVNPKIVDDKILWIGKGKKTVDYQNIKDRFESLNITVEWERLNKINDYRNNIEHYFSSLEHAAIQGLISNSFIIIRDFISEQLEQDPKKLLGESYLTLIEINEVYEKELNECHTSMESLDFLSETILDSLKSYSCQACGASLITPTEKNVQAYTVDFICKSCGEEHSYEETVVSALENYYAGEMYIAMTQGDVHPLADCPFCGQGAYLYEEMICASCGESANHECGICGSGISSEELSDGDLCSYCAHIHSKDD